MKGRVAMLYGAETPLGVQITKVLEELGIGVLLRPSDHHAEKAVQNIHREIRAKKPSVVINCLLDPDSGFYPQDAMANLIAPTHAMVQRARVSGARYIHCSSARVYGQQERLSGREGYSEYDPWLAYGDDPWRAVCQAVEASLWQQVSPMNFQAKSETHMNFEHYCLRFGHLLFRAPPDPRPVDAYSLARCVNRIKDGHCNFRCGRTSQLVSPIDVTSAAEAIGELCKARPRATSGTYHLGSTNAVSIEGLFDYLSMKSGNALCVGSLCAAAPGATEIYGVDADQALDTSNWSELSRTKLPTWRQAVDRVFERQALQTIL